MAYYSDQPAKDHTATVIPDGFAITHYRAKVAYGAVKPRSSGGGGAKPTSHIARNNDRRNLTNYAAKSIHSNYSRG